MRKSGNPLRGEKVNKVTQEDAGGMGNLKWRVMGGMLG